VSEEQIIKDLLIRLRAIEEQLGTLQVSVAKIEANMKIVSAVGGLGLTLAGAILAKLLL
jgi:hypothetical protein|tara:strand:- start:49 stop:225 length:177 start_codon:yes stop_codon:yes gene_type:complete